MPAFLQDLPLLDAAALLLIGGFAVAGALKGAIRLIVGVVALVGGTLLASQYAGSVGADAWPVVSTLEDPQRAGVLVGGVVILIGTVVVGGLVARLLRRAAEESELGGLDRLVGLLLGALKGAVVTALLTLGLVVLEPVDASGSLREHTETSRSLAGTRSLVEACRSWIPAETMDTLETVLRIDPEQQQP